MRYKKVSKLKVHLMKHHGADIVKGLEYQVIEAAEETCVQFVLDLNSTL